MLSEICKNTATSEVVVQNYSPVQPCLIRNVAKADDITAYQANNCDFTQFKHTEDTSYPERYFVVHIIGYWQVEKLEVLVLIYPLKKAVSEGSPSQIIVILKGSEPYLYFL